jgi:hypothetical protein
MKNNVRIYQTLKFFRGSKRKTEEMQRLADAGQDFDYRKLLIEENEYDMFIAFSKEVIWKWLAWDFLSLAISLFRLPIAAFVLVGLAVVSLFFSYLNKRFFQFVLRGHNLALGFVEGVIFDKYGISFQ